MNGFRRLLYKLTFALLVGAGFACVKKPTYPNSPVISDARISFLREGNEQVLRLDFKYTDGDGNLGLSPGDTMAPFNRLLSNGQVNPNYYNIIVDFYTLNPFTLEYEFFDFQGFNYYGRFPLLADTDYKGPIEGRLRYDLKSINFFGGQRTDLKLRVYIRDRDLNQSNTIDSPSIIINQ
jgi:hypothetical protein